MAVWFEPVRTVGSRHAYRRPRVGLWSSLEGSGQEKSEPGSP